MIGGEAVGGGELDLILSLFDHGPGEQVCKRVVGDAQLLLDEPYYGGRCVLCRTLMGVSCVALILTFDETHVARGQVFDANIGHAAAAASHGHLFSCLGYCAELSALEPNIFGGRCCGLRVQRRVELVRIFVVNVTQILGMGYHFVLARICAIEMRTNHVDGIDLCAGASLMRNELPVTTARKIMLGLHGVAI